MTQFALEIQHSVKNIPNGIGEQRIMDDLNLAITPGEFVVILGGNGAGKSTLFNSISGNLKLSAGQVLINGEDVTKLKAHQRASQVAQVFQDPKMGTAPRMTVAENLLLATLRGQKRGLTKAQLAKNYPVFEKACLALGNGLEQHLDTPAGQLSGGQRQALSLLMATMTTPTLLLLDEHTAALDPKVAKELMAFTNQKIQAEQLTCLMITHEMSDALKYGNRLLVLEKGQIKADLNAEQKAELSLVDLYQLFEK